MRSHRGPYVPGCRIAMQMTNLAGRTGIVLRVETRQERRTAIANIGMHGILELPRDTGSLESPGVYPVPHPCFLIVQFDGPDPQVEGPVEIDGADCAGLVDGYPIASFDCEHPYARLPPEVLEAMPEISRDDRPYVSPQEYECGCVAISRITDRGRGEKAFEMVRAIACVPWCRIPFDLANEPIAPFEPTDNHTEAP